MGAIGHDLLGAVRLEGSRRLAKGAGGIHQVVDEHTGAPLDVTDDVHHLRLVGPGPPLIDDRQVRIIKALGQRAGTHHAPDVRGDHHEIGILLAPNVPEQDGRRVDIVHGDVEKPLDLIRVQVHSDHPIGARLADHLGRQPRGDRHPGGAGPPILTRIAEIRDDGGDALGGGPPQRVYHHQQLHQVVVGGRTGGLHNEDVPASDVLLDLRHHLAVAELPDHGLAEGKTEVRHDLRREIQVGIPGEHHHLGGGHGRSLRQLGRHGHSSAAPAPSPSAGDRRAKPGIWGLRDGRTSASSSAVAGPRVWSMAGAPGFEPGNAGIKTQCLNRLATPQ